MGSINLSSLTKRFDDVIAVNSLDLELHDGELIALLGPSGCGKTTTLRMIAGFEKADEGTISIGDRNVTTLAPEKRNAGMVFQNYALFPHLTVYQNVAFGLEMRKVPKNEIRDRVLAILDKVQLGGLDARYPRQLSGGQQQRTALARALVINPEVLLLDEPLANLDAKLREEMRFYIRSLQQEFEITTVYVTHDQAEALVLADRIAVMMNGVIEQLGTPEEIYRRPETPVVADFVGLTNLVPGSVTERSDNRISVETGAGLINGMGPDDLTKRDDVLVSIRPETMRLEGVKGTAGLMGSEKQAESSSGVNQLEGDITEQAFLGNLIDYRIDVGGGQVFRVQAAPTPSYTVGERVNLAFPESEVWVVKNVGGTIDVDSLRDEPGV
jgi:putative spermidine/putrescine transport system ATP-binding protein